MQSTVEKLPTENLAINLARESRAELMRQIGDFVIKHDIEITGPNLSAIAAGLSGADVALARAFAAREIANEPITQSWLDQIAQFEIGGGERTSALETLMDRMEITLHRFAQTAQNAHSETSEHRGAIDEQIAKMAQTVAEASPRAEIDRLMDMSRVMLDRIGQVESAMKESQLETAKLRTSLAEARSEAEIDHLTRLPNRRAFERELARVAKLAEEKGEALSLAFCDVDNFKAINDKHGHDAGDRVLVAIARTLQRHASDHCYAARHGGEEFVLLFPGLTREEARKKLDGIRRDQSTRRLINRESGKSFGKVTFSGGVSEVKDLADTTHALARADRALYQAKEAGRNRVVGV